MAPNFRRVFRHGRAPRWRSGAGLLVLATLWPAWTSAAGPQTEPVGTPQATPRVATAPQVAPVPAPAPVPAAPPVQVVDVSSDAHRYCKSIAAAAADSRFAWQAGQIKALESQLQSRIQELDAKEAETRDILARRDAAMKRAGETLVGIYAKMRPDAAAAQISALDDDTAAAVLAQLNPRTASAILNEVSPERAVQLVNAIAMPAGKKS